VDERWCKTTVRPDPRHAPPHRRGGPGRDRKREKSAKLAQKLVHLQLYSHRNAWANLHLLGQPNTLLAKGGARPAAHPHGPRGRPCPSPRLGPPRNVFLGPRNSYCCQARCKSRWKIYSRAPLGGFGSRALSEKDAELAQKLGQLQPFLAVFPQECMGQLAPFGPTEQLARCPGPRARRARAPPRHAWGSVALSLCTTAHPRYNIFTNISGTSMSEATVRPNPLFCLYFGSSP
jgi:hypothetical protein